jgi:hypothetical protein
MTSNQPPYQPLRKMTSVTKQRGLSAGAHGRHMMLTICTCGLWLPVYGCWWMFRLFFRRKQKTTYRPR